MKWWMIATVCALGFGLTSARATADSPQPLYVLAQRYEVELEIFDKIAGQVRGIDRVDHQQIDRLEREAKQLKLAARNPRHFNRLFHQWQKVQQLHSQTESAVFTKYTPHHELIGQWERVWAAQTLFAEEFFLHVENPSHDTTVRKRSHPSIRRDRYLPNLGPAGTLTNPTVDRSGGEYVVETIQVVP